MTDIQRQSLAWHQFFSTAAGRPAGTSSNGRPGATMSSAPRLLGRRVLVTGVLVVGAAGAWAQQAPPVVVDREGAEQVRAGERFEYQLEVRNQSDVPVKDVRIDEFVPPDQQEQQQGQAPQQGQQQGQQQAERQDQGAQQQGQRRAQQQSQDAQSQQDGEYGVSRMIPFLAPGESRSITVSGVAREEGTMRSCVAVDYTPATCADIEVVKPDISLSCDMARPEADVYEDGNLDANTFYACDTVVLTCLVRNEGSGATKPTQLSFDLPEGLEAADDGQAEMQIDSIEPGETREVTLRLAARQARDYQLQPSLTTEGGDMTAEPIAVRVIQPELELAVQAPSEEYLNRPVRYTVNLRNPGDVAVPATRLMIDPPEQLENRSVSSENVAAEDGSYTIGMLRAGESRSVTLTGDAVDSGTATLEAAAEGYCVETKQATAEVQLQGVPALVLVAYDERDPIAVGNQTTYDIKVRNQGTAAADNIELSGTLGDRLTFVEGDGQTKVSGSGGSFELEPVTRLEPGQSAGWTVTVKGDSEGYGRLDLKMTSTATKRSITEQEPTRVIK